MRYMLVPILIFFVFSKQLIAAELVLQPISDTYVYSGVPLTPPKPLPPPKDQIRLYVGNNIEQNYLSQASLLKFDISKLHNNIKLDQAILSIAYGYYRYNEDINIRIFITPINFNSDINYQEYLELPLSANFMRILNEPDSQISKYYSYDITNIVNEGLLYRGITSNTLNFIISSDTNESLGIEKGLCSIEGSLPSAILPECIGFPTKLKIIYTVFGVGDLNQDNKTNLLDINAFLLSPVDLTSDNVISIQDTISMVKQVFILQ